MDDDGDLTNPDTLTHLRESGMDAGQTRRLAQFSRDGIGGGRSRFTAEELEANAGFWEHVARLLDAGEADWV